MDWDICTIRSAGRRCKTTWTPTGASLAMKTRNGLDIVVTAQTSNLDDLLLVPGLRDGLRQIIHHLGFVASDFIIRRAQ